MMAGAEDPEAFYRSVILPDKLALAADYARDVSLRRDFALILRTLRKIAE